MSEKLCLQWNDFQDNVKSTFGNLRESSNFVDVTLACEDGHQIEAHKVILAASSPFFQAILMRNKHSHPLIYMRGVKSDDLIAIVDFLYCGEANVDQENLDSFLAIAEELQLKGLRGTDDDKRLKEKEIQMKPAHMAPELNYLREQKTPHRRILTKEVSNFDELSTKAETENNALALQTHFSGDLQQLDETVKSMMETSQNLIEHGKRQERQRSKICKVCGKEGQLTDIKRHIESNHLEGILIPCDYCGKTVSSRHRLTVHKKKIQK